VKWKPGFSKVSFHTFQRIAPLQRGGEDHYTYANVLKGETLRVAFEPLDTPWMRAAVASDGTLVGTPYRLNPADPVAWQRLVSNLAPMKWKPGFKVCASNATCTGYSLANGRVGARVGFVADVFYRLQAEAGFDAVEVGDSCTSWIQLTTHSAWDPLVSGDSTLGTCNVISWFS
jgi:hypothetical protein